MPARERGFAQTARLVLLRNLPLAAVVAAGVGVLWLVRPGVVTNGARSPVLWLVLVSVVVGAKLLGLLVRRLTGRRAAGTAASVTAALLASYVLLAPSFTQRTLEEPFPDLEPVAAAPQLPTSAPQAAPEVATEPSAAPTPPPVESVPGDAAPAQPPAAPPSRQAPQRTPGGAVKAPAPAAPAPAAPAPAAPAPTSKPGTPAPAAASPARQVSSGELEGVGHSASGRTAFYEVDGGKIVRFEDVDIEGTPGPVVYLVRSGARSPDGGVRVGELKAEKGTFSYQLPSSVDLQQGWTVLVWCEPYNTPIAAADH